MRADFYRSGALSEYIEGRNNSTNEWIHDLYHSPFKEELIRIHGIESYNKLNRYRGCKDAKGGEEAARIWREMI